MAERIEKVARIEGTFLGREDHGIVTAMLTVTYGDSGQGVGGYRLDAPGGLGTAYGMTWVIRAMDACGVDCWERVKGRTVLVYFDGDVFGRPVGIGPLPTEPGKPFLFDDLASEMYGEAAVG